MWESKGHLREGCDHQEGGKWWAATSTLAISATAMIAQAVDVARLRTFLTVLAQRYQQEGWATTIWRSRPLELSVAERSVRSSVGTGTPTIVLLISADRFPYLSCRERPPILRGFTGQETGIGSDAFGRLHPRQDSSQHSAQWVVAVYYTARLLRKGVLV